MKTLPRRVLKKAGLGIAAFLVFYFGVVGLAMYRVDTSLDFAPSNPVAGGSHAVNMLEALIVRETIDNQWTPNNPWFFPTFLQDNMPNFQRGMMRAISRFSMELEAQIARTRGSGAIDGDLERATGLLQFPTDSWFFDFDQSVLPILPADLQFRTAARSLRMYNERIARGTAVFETRQDVLAFTLERISGEIGARAAIIENHMASRTLIDFVSDDIFYFNKGMAYAYYMILRELRHDFDEVIRSQGLTRTWEQALDNLRFVSQQKPLIVMNARGMDSIFANHLYVQGFYLKRAIVQLDDIARVIRAAR